MGYEFVLSKAWEEIDKVAVGKNFSIRFLTNEYNVDVENKRILLGGYNASTKEYISVLILRYLKQKIIGLPNLKEKWISFRELEGGEGYFLSFKRRVINTILEKYGSNPEKILLVVDRMKAKRVQFGDLGIIIEIFKNVPVLITLWCPDEEFDLEVNILFDECIKDIFSTEDIVLLSETIAHKI